MSYRAGLRASLHGGQPHASQHSCMPCMIASNRTQQLQLLIRIACSNRKTKYF